MKKSEIKIGGKYIAKVSNKLSTVQVLEIGKTEKTSYRKGGTWYDCKNLSTGRQCTFRSAAKFRREIRPFDRQVSPKSHRDVSKEISEKQFRENCEREETEAKNPKLSQAAKRRVEQIEAKYSTEEGATEEERQEAQDILTKVPSYAQADGKTVSQMLKKFSDSKKSTAPHLIVEARAGTGKTTTLIEGLKVMRGEASAFTPSPQQALIWESMELSKDAKSVCFVAFGKSIATELQNRVPQGCEAMTTHSMGYRAIRDTFGQFKVDNFRVQNIIEEITGKDIWDLKRKKPNLVKAVEKLVGLCKMNLTLDCIVNDGVFADEALLELAAYHDVDLNGDAAEVIALIPKVLERCKDVAKDNSIDYADMIWLPVVLNLPVTKYDLLLVDEAQDLNRCQQQLALKASRRLILVGDPKQAIYGFAGADSKSMERMKELLSNKFLTATHVKTEGSVATMKKGCGCDVLPLTVTRRCGRAIVKEAQQIVPDFEAHETCCDGRVWSATMYSEKASFPDTAIYREYVENGDMILCRVNAPLVSECFKFLKQGRKANIQGRDVGQGLISTIKKLMKGYTLLGYKGENEIIELTIRLSRWLSQETMKENAKKFPSEPRLIALQDRHDCLCCFCEDQETVESVIKKIENVFTDDKHGKRIKLSSVHKAKGLEADRVFILLPENGGMPHPMARSEWQIEQEYNLKYVAITRAIKELVYVS